MLPGSKPQDIKKGGLGYWAERVLQECDKASQGFAADPVHDLRVAIRRCRSMADGFLSIDPDPGWKQMKRAAKPLFSALGNLRDVQVMNEWVARISEESDPIRQVLKQSLSHQEIALKASAEEALHRFDRRQWATLNARLAKRSEQIPKEGLVFQHLALERWNEAHELHRQALRNRSQVGYHQLRIGIKRFRYTVENFLPQRHEKWSRDLRDLQDALGEVHDLDVLRAMIRTHPEFSVADRQRWQARISEERLRRLDFYRRKMLGSGSLWRVWRAELPRGEALQQAAFEKLRTWAAFLDPDARHSEHVTHLALQLYDGMAQQDGLVLTAEYRRILEAAAALHELGRSKGEKGHRNRTYRIIRKLKAPLGWTDEQLHCVAVVAQLHRGQLPKNGDSSFVGLSAERRKQLMVVGGILRLADAFDWGHDRSISKILVTVGESVITIRGEGLQAISNLGERLARQRYLLESSCGKAILIRPAAARRSSASSAPEQGRAATGS